VKKVIIIGAGIGGIATAALLAKRGYDVHVYEQQSSPGGRAGSIEIDGFTFDTGPSWYLMPEVFENFFALLGEDISKHLELQRLDPAYKVFYESQSPITIHADTTRDGATFESIEKGAGRKLTEYLKDSEQTYTLAVRQFLYTNFDSLAPFRDRQVVRAGGRMLTSALRPIDSHVSRYFSDQRLKQIMEYPMVFLGTSPYKAPAIYSLMSHMDFTQGVYYPRGGMYEIITALVNIASTLGVRFHYGATVAAISYTESRATGITLADSTTILGDIVISAADLHFTETELLPPTKQTYPDSYWQKKQVSPSALLMYLGVKGSLPTLEHHNLLFTDDWEANFSDIFDRKVWPHPASIYLCKPSHTDISVAPEGHENVFVLVPGPATLDDVDTEKLSDAYLDQIATMTGVADLKDRIVVKKLFGPHDFASQFNSWNGTALGLSHLLSQSALFRPRNKSRKLSNLYYAGGNTVPGIGLPMCLISAQLVLKRLEGDTSARPILPFKDVPS
jgi:phytoene desaturase